MENIGNIHFRKGIQPKKAEKKEAQKQAPAQENKMTEQERTILEKIRSKAISSYVAAAMMMGAGAGALTSCAESEAWVNNEPNQAEQEFMNTMMEMMKTIIANQEKNNEQNETMIGQNKIIIEQNNKRADQNTKMLEILTNIYSGVKDIKTGVLEMSALLKEGNKYDVQFLEKVDVIINGQKTDQEKMQALLQLVQEQNQTLQNIESMINAAMEKDQALGDTLMKFYEAFVTSDQRNEQYQNTHTDLMNKVLQELKNSNAIDTATLYEIQQFHKDYTDGKIEESQMWENITNILNGIKNELGEIKDAIKDLSATIVEYGDKFLEKQDQQIDILSNMDGNLVNIGNDIKELKQLQKENNETLVNLSNSVDKINVKLDQIAEKQGDMITIDQLRDLVGPSFNQIIDILGGIHGSQISIEDVKDAMEAYKTDLTKTNALIETLTTVVQNLQLNGDSEALKELAQLLAGLKDSVDQGNAANLEALEGIRADLAGIQGSLEALVQTANDIKGNQDKFMLQAQTFGTKLFEELAKIGDKQIDPAKFEMFAESYKEQLVLAQQTREEQSVALQTIIENMGKGTGGSVDIDELVAKLPNYTDILNEIREELGDHVTAQDIKNIYEKTDLTKTNNLIETLTTVVQNLNLSGGSSNIDNQILEAIRTSVNQILSALNNGQVASEQQVNALLDALGRIENNTQQNPQTRGTYVHEGWIYE